MRCKHLEACKKDGIIPERVRRGYAVCKNNGIYTVGPRKGKPCYFAKRQEIWQSPNNSRKGETDE